MDPTMTRRSMLRGGALLAGAAAGAGLMQMASSTSYGRPDTTATLERLHPRQTVVRHRRNLIEAHTGGMFFQDDTYYWVGANWQGPYGFHAFQPLLLTNL